MTKENRQLLCGYKGLPIPSILSSKLFNFLKIMPDLVDEVI
jgi:hypothetical protein